jgi:lipid-binding SYLF domain-containing protein
MAAPDKGIPQDMLDHAQCIVIVPDLKTAAFFFGAKYGKGFLSCRNRGGAGWSAPAAVRIDPDLPRDIGPNSSSEPRGRRSC